MTAKNSTESFLAVWQFVYLGDASKIRNVLAWKPEYDFKSLVKEMVEVELLSIN